MFSKFGLIFIVLFMFLIIWAIARQPHSPPPQVVHPPTATYPGKAESIVNYLFQGTDIPGWSVAPVTKQPAPTPSQDNLELIRQSTQQRITENLAQQLGNIPIENIALVSWSERTWMFSGLGCAPKTDIIVPVNAIPGWIFVFRVASNPTIHFIYHSDQKGNFRYCVTQPAQ